jgi:uncharacterized membrane protein YcaP (DUF421 family)
MLEPMKQEEIFLNDIKRILIGNAPPEFLLEVFFRTLAVYLCLIVVVRMLGKRMSGEVTITEMAVMITLGAIVGSPTQIPDRGVVVGILLLVYILFFQWSLSTLSFYNPLVERITQGELSILVKDGVIQLNELKRKRISQQQLFAKLREQQITHLGNVARVYLEATGIFSVYKNKTPRPGLATLPLEDPSLYEQQPKAKHLFACRVCGTVHNDRPASCTNCGENKWSDAIQ